jgi:cytochrome c heme-lyase
MGSSVSREDISSSSSSHGVSYNVYGQPINPDNHMPLTPAQQPWNGQRTPLATQRVKSNIPKGGNTQHDETWAYPSPQMFFNAMQRKGKGQGVREEDINVALSVHNNTNERAWKLLLQWEDQRNENTSPKLLKFGGVQTLSPKAWIRAKLMGYPEPFDRHDWIVERGNTQMRYIVDFYSDDKKNHLDSVPGLHDHDAVRSIFLDVRPALDTLEGIKLRIANMFKSTGETLPAEPDTNQVIQGREIMQKSLQVSSQDLKTFIQSQCARPLSDLAACVEANGRGSENCAKPFIGANFCIGNVLCPDKAMKFLSSLKDAPETTDVVMQEMIACISESTMGKSVFEPEPLKVDEPQTLTQ